ncbi:transcription initiation factor tfiid 55 kDa subunit [Coprinopsis cinerea okayama7|uniref:Transcription initiation factor tfiid 55 kDa subunit n=1 Tax=Coprinopsis cinerea (strain Okayama-7 / 130 / ATCC MYA-4618 / FGSC 9003) TaxID=240176 RepID=A8NET9_COPC7|nr:transcription initiation factor tfiid 55 kDa subunit [Coprinopsis cinerea okayama7\|eukprot:XP_001833126.2 transcription initiation factor tfiid 55 kDa subunit [Coprinopsis cinerea okayama7\
MDASTSGNERTTRSAVARAKGGAPKLKLKLGEKSAAQAPGMSFLGAYDRELDSDDEDLSFEEQFILRFPPGEDLEKLRKMVANREVSNDVWFKFKDSRRAVFHIGNNLYSAKLVDLPCIIESQKTLDNKQMFKVADICQARTNMLVVEDKIQDESQVANQRNFNIDDFVWPHGITPPLHHVRKRRFRKRVNRRTIESVEQEVERLLEEDAAATEVKYEQEAPLDAPTPAVSDLGEAATPGADLGEEYDEEPEENEEEEEEQEGDIDEELAAELDLALGDEEEVEEEGEEEESSEEEEDEDEDDEEAQARQLLNEEIRDLQAAVAKKENEITSSANPLLKKRFQDALKKLTADLELKISQRDEMREKQRLKKEGGDQGGQAGPNANQAEDDDDDLFGNDDMEMDIG